MKCFGCFGGPKADAAAASPAVQKPEPVVQAVAAPAAAAPQAAPARPSPSITSREHLPAPAPPQPPPQPVPVTPGPHALALQRELAACCVGASSSWQVLASALTALVQRFQLDVARCAVRPLSSCTALGLLQQRDFLWDLHAISCHLGPPGVLPVTKGASEGSAPRSLSR